MSRDEALFFLRRSWRYLDRQAALAQTDHDAAIAQSHALAIWRVMEHLEGVASTAPDADHVERPH
jgi:hypothetical protein